MLDAIYYKLHRLFSRSGEKDEYSSGPWQDLVRQQALSWCSGMKGKLLELGCGEGLFLAQLKNRNPGLELWGIDNNVSRVERAGIVVSGRGINLGLGDATTLAFRDCFFDTTVCINALFNMPSEDAVRKTISEMRRVTKPDGRMIFDFRNAGNPLLKIKYSLAPLYDKTVKGLPLRTYSIAVIEGMMRELDCEIVEKMPLGKIGFLPPAIIIIKARRK